MTQLFGFIAAIIIGITLGVIGGGGSILTVPVLVYLSGIEPVPATAYSLFVVGLTALIGSTAYMRSGRVSYRTAIVFGIPSLAAVYLTRRFLVPALPENLFTLAGIPIGRDPAIMLLFAVLMLGASISMIRRDRRPEISGPREFRYGLILLEGTVVGAVTGLVGAGGGFLIIPALVLLARLPMQHAVGTSLLIIAAKSLVGFTGDIVHLQVDWRFLGMFAGLAVAGILVGSRVSKHIPPTVLKPAFGWFTLAMGVFIIGKELAQFRL
jgi:uncharacterized membrane protein YfcA